MSLPFGASDPAWPDDAIEVGKVVDAWGIQGALKVKPFATEPQALFASKRWFLLPPLPALAQGKPLAPEKKPASYLVFKVSRAQEQGDHIVATSLDIPDRNTAESLRGARIFVSRSSFPTPPDNEYYWVDLIGLTVVNRQNEVLGTVEGLIDTGPHSVLRIRPDDKTEERLVPFVAAYIDEVDLAKRLIQVDWGLDYS
ncbi:MAG: ribosome maturation factor RimM [Burkholderiales bacterium]|jgi:16S rRNA processing protein RimM